jgi:class 3 adenylate cyclase
MLKTANHLSAQLAPVHVSEAAFLFADISGYTAYTETQGDVRAAELAWRLRLGVEGQLTDDAHVVKTLGDAVMVRIADPEEAAAAGLRIVSRALPGAGDPPVRVGIHCGPAVEWAGDFFGAAVNLAARVASVARPGEVIVTAAVAVAARRHGLQVDELGERTFRNVARPVLVHAVRDGFTRSGRPPRPAPDPPAPPRCRGTASISTGSEAARVQL